VSEFKRDGAGRWPLEFRLPGQMLIEIDEGASHLTQWITLRPLRLLNWCSAQI